jgi:carboxymethylenebutenolidase
MYRTDMYEGLLAETVMMTGANGDWINAYFARPLGAGPFPAMVLAHHMPGWDEWYREITVKFAQHGYATITPNLYFRAGHGTPEDVAAKVRGEGGIPDEQVVDDLAGARGYVRQQPYSNGKVGVFGTCSGGRHAYLAACRTGGFDAIVDCWGGRVVMTEDQLNPKTPVSPLEYTKDLSCPILGIFGNEDRNPTPEQVDQH